jgi:hypothetical protein
VEHKQKTASRYRGEGKPGASAESSLNYVSSDMLSAGRGVNNNFSGGESSNLTESRQQTAMKTGAFID